jgi:hypothetical protein
MKKNLFIIFILQISLLVYADDDALYALKFSYEYSNISDKFNGKSYSINNVLRLKNSNNDFEIFITKYGFYDGSRTIYISPQNGQFNLEFSTYISGNDVSISNCFYTPYIKTIRIEPNSFDLGTGRIEGTFNGSGTTVLCNTTYHLEIRPKKIDCTNLGTTSGEKELLYDDPICIQATKGFPKDVYKWRYSYKNAQGIPVEGYLYPYKTEDNGATIYVKGSDFLSVSTFHDLVYRDEAISIIPDGADGYNKPLSVEGVNLTAKLTAPFIVKPIEVIQPKCDGYNAEQVKIKLSRSLLKGEVVKFLLIHENGKPQITDSLSLTGDNAIIFDYNDSVIIGNWMVQVSGTYLDKDNQLNSSYSETNNHQGEFTITAPSPITINNILPISTSCINRADGSVSCEVNGGTGRKICSLYNTDNKLISCQMAQDGRFVFTDLAKGSYYLVAEDVNKCSSENTYALEISEPQPLALQITETTELKCFGDSNGVVGFSISGGTGNKTIILKDENHQFIEDYQQTEESVNGHFTNLLSGIYYLSATDKNGCTTHEDRKVEISEPDSLWLELTITDATIYGKCNGSVSASFGGGTGSYQLALNDDIFTSFFSETDKPLSRDLCAGELEVTLIDGNHCTTTKKDTINQPDPLSAKVKQVDSIKCFGENTASLIVDSIKGGIPPYSVFWYNDNFSSEDFRIQDLPADEYKVEITDSKGAKFELSITIDQPQRLEFLPPNIKPTNCRGDNTGSISLTAEGGFLPYRFFLEELASISGEFANLPAGTYKAVVEDKNNCSTEGLFTIETLSTLTANLSAESPRCDYQDDGIIDLSIQEGIAPYHVKWYKNDALLAENINSLTHLSAGKYAAVVEDAVGCIERAEATLLTPEPLPIALPKELYLCQEQSYPITLQDKRINGATWYLNDHEYSNSTHEILTQEGKYQLDILYDDVCHKYEEIVVDTINKKVEANFLVAEEIPIHNDAHLINITPKENYEYVEWVYPESETWIYGEDENSFQLVFLSEGTWQVGMIAYNDQCEASLYKTIHTIAHDKTTSQHEIGSLITDLSINQSPNNGVFTAHVALSARASINLYLYSASTGHIITKKQATNNKEYNIPFSVDASQGEYILLLVVPDWQKSSWIKMIIF